MSGWPGPELDLRLGRCRSTPYGDVQPMPARSTATVDVQQQCKGVQLIMPSSKWLCTRQTVQREGSRQARGELLERRHQANEAGGPGIFAICHVKARVGSRRILFDSGLLVRPARAAVACRTACLPAKSI